ncbi:glycosyltransferase [Candidatus Gottesmanbacteria bacterium]|nr:glycosyltransferase [Candidatus Gottesmanbacteria bacterium]
MGKFSFNIIANGVWGPEGLSGGDNIFINFSKILQKLGHEVNVYTWEDGFELCQSHGLKDVNFNLWPVRKFKFLGFAGLYLLRTLKGCFEVLRMKKPPKKKLFFYSASDFWPDSIPGFLMSRRLKAKWIAGFYLFAPNPLSGVRNFFYWFTQKPIFWLISKYADLICVTSEPDGEPFVKAGRKQEDTFVVKGGIDYQHLKELQKPAKKIYDAVFVGRFHPQKGVLEMIDVWKTVTDKLPGAKLAVIGVGPLENKMKEKVEKYGLMKNIDFLGPLIGDEKNKILQQAKIFLHPVIYDSGGMAPADGLACGLPGVCFDLPVFKSYYSQGFMRAQTGNTKIFAQKIIELLNDKMLYQKLSDEAILEARTWDWQNRVESFLAKVKDLW